MNDTTRQLGTLIRGGLQPRRALQPSDCIIEWIRRWVGRALSANSVPNPQPPGLSPLWIWTCVCDLPDWCRRTGHLIEKCTHPPATVRPVSGSIKVFVLRHRERAPFARLGGRAIHLGGLASQANPGHSRLPECIEGSLDGVKKIFCQMTSHRRFTAVASLLDSVEKKKKNEESCGSE